MAWDALSRREFLRHAVAAVAAGAGVPAIHACLDFAGPDEQARSRLLQPPPLGVTGARLVAQPGHAAVAEGETAGAWLFNGSLPGPTLRARRGDTVHLDLINGLPEPTIVHWHGLVVPDGSDGHPRHAVAPGSSFAYSFPVRQRAGTYWYHPHAHHLTAGQIHRGLAGFFLIGDDEESSLSLPSGEHEILLMLQDRDAAAATALEYAPGAGDLHHGLLRGTPFGNGVRHPALDVAGGCYRFRIVNASQARVYRLGLSSGGPITVIGNDGGLLGAAVQVADVWLGVGERIDVLLDFTNVPPGTRLFLRSMPFDVPSGGGKSPQGSGLDLLALTRTETSAPGMPSLPPSLSSVTPLGSPIRDRTFELSSSADAHRMNGRAFDVKRIDLEVPFGEIERWTFRNLSALPHPVHMHGTQFRLVARTGGRGTVFPYEAGWKDTALVMPEESVEVLVPFDAYRGLFLLHCHNLQHEDLGMMLNVAIV
jgi:FtsP/CotA-like multicopper oxidase with cupredoxin domain